ncbi:hypothetical protein SKP52_06450 [Sphingopyxis fribergensis]|uniref:Sulfatase N-terminal domain-containing protein n=1 Tax=Sphingopyxis fribergensis TaxID=1515612 RepID=A0A0A7PDZ4_9SPHN|nr:hypothetical protein [Sphingopyxis fribergensis]AJA08215.1 hypothetical protein SKP52_06450 [Sphingopyxis fribergensis]
MQIARDFPWRWALWWLVLPNLAFIAMWPIGGPRMAVPMTICGVIILLASGWGHHPARTLLAIAMFAFSLMLYTTMSFNLEPTEMLNSIEFAGELDPVQSPEYLFGGVVLAASLVALVVLGPRIPPLKTRDHRIVAVALILLLINADVFATAATRGSYKMRAPEGVPVDSAAIQNDIRPATVKARNLLVIVVESWGVSSDPYDRALQDQLWNPRRWSGRYEVTRGKSRYYGSTTSAELRELCGVWSAGFKSYDFDRADCLPKEFRVAGFQVDAMHSFNGVFFDRAVWYPKIGFERALFAKELIARGADHCSGSVFPGACDNDIPRLIGQRLREEPGIRKFIYWLTLNGHIPVPASPELGTDDCRLGDAAWRDQYPMLCRGFELQRQLADSISAEIMKPDFPDTDILIVGDHMPPYFKRDMRMRFDSAHVPWIMLRSRHGAKPPAQARVASQ